jgi:hypothetical protein
LSCHLLFTKPSTQSESLPVQSTEPWPPDNNEWVKALSGQLGAARQRQSHDVLGNYLYIVAYNYLRLYQGNLPLLARRLGKSGRRLCAGFLDPLDRQPIRSSPNLSGRRQLSEVGGGGSQAHYRQRIQKEKLA